MRDSTYTRDGITYLYAAYKLGNYFWYQDREAYILHINHKDIIKAKFVDTNEVFYIRRGYERP